MTDRALFAIAPLCALASLGVVTFVRYAWLRPPGGLPRQSLGDARELLWRGRAWRLGMTGTALVHLALLLPTQAPNWMSSPGRLLALESVALALGACALAGLLLLIRRRLRAAASGALSLADAMLLGLLLVEIASGIGIAVRYRWAASWSTVTLAPYVRSLATLEPRLPLIGVMPYLVKLHVFCAIAILAILPFSHAAAFVLVPADRVLSRVWALAAAAQRRAAAAVAPLARRGIDALALGREED